jgi:hypothetical protein
MRHLSLVIRLLLVAAVIGVVMRLLRGRPVNNTVQAGFLVVVGNAFNIVGRRMPARSSRERLRGPRR